VARGLRAFKVPGCNNAQDSPGTAVSDVDSTTQVKTVLRQDDAVKHVDINVNTEKALFGSLAFSTIRTRSIAPLPSLAPSPVGKASTMN
jgi:hypothetical protein